MHILWFHESFDEYIADITEAYYREFYDAMVALADSIRGSPQVPLPFPDSMSQQRVKCQAVANEAWQAWQGRADEDEVPQSETQWLHQWALDMQHRIKQALVTGESFASCLWWPVRAGVWLEQQHDLVSKLSNEAGDRIAEFFDTFDLHSGHEEHPVLGRLRQHEVGELPSSHDILGWVSKYSKQAVVAICLAFLHNEVADASWRKGLASQLFTALGE